MTDLQPKTLLKLLGINRDRIPRESMRCTEYFENRWIELGQPVEVESLMSFLDSTINFCGREDFKYPKVFLLRLKQMQRGEWPPGGLNRGRVKSDGGTVETSSRDRTE